MIATAALAVVAATATLSQGRKRLAAAGLLLPAAIVIALSLLPAISGAVGVGAVFAVATFLAWSGMIPASVPTQLGTAVGSGVAISVAALVAQSAAGVSPALGGIVFATVVAAFEIVGSRGSPLGEWGSLAHSQVRSGWALQCATASPHAVTAVLVAASSSVGFALTTQSWAAGSVGLILLAAMLVVHARWKQGKGSQLSADLQIVGLVEADSTLFTRFVPRFVERRTISSTDWHQFETEAERQHLDLLRRTADAVETGASIVVWAEGAGLVPARTYDVVLSRTQIVAREAGCTVVASWLVLDSTDGLMDNVTTVIDQEGQIAATYHKAHPVPGAEMSVTRQHESEPQAVDTALGRLVTVICFDADHHDTWHKISLLNPDVVVIPASDWPAIATLHADMAHLRSRSARAALVRVARYGISGIYSSDGTTVATVDHRGGASPDLVGSL